MSLTTQQTGSLESTIECEFPTTEAQREVWLQSKINQQANCAFNECASLRLKGQLDSGALQTALNRVVERNEMLRATFTDDGENVCIDQLRQIEIVHRDWSNMCEAEQEHAYNAAICAEGGTPFDLENGPLLRLRLQKISDTEHLLTFTAHHLILDGWSLWVFFRDLGHIYTSTTLGITVDLPEANSYREYSEMMRQYHQSAEGAADEAFWLREFAESTPVLHLPSDRPRPALKTFSAERITHTVDAHTVRELRAAGGKAGCSLFHSMLGVFNSMLSRFAQQSDICVGIPTSGQSAMEQPDLIGHCVNMLPIRTEVDLKQSSLEFVKQVRSKMLDVMDHQKFTFGALVRKLAPQRDPSRTPLFTVSFNVDPAINSVQLGFDGFDLELIVEPRTFESFDWFINGVILPTGAIELQCQYNTDLFDAATIRDYMECYQTLLESFVADPGQRLQELTLTSCAQRQQIVVDWNNTEADYASKSTVHEQFMVQAATTPGNVAVCDHSKELTYDQLDQASNRIARFLQCEGVTRGDLVGICVERSADMVSALLGIWKAGAGYVPLDPNYPIDRLKYMAENSDLKLLLSHSSLVEATKALGKPTVMLDEKRDAIQAQSDQPLNLSYDRTDVAYVIYTSGSTGTPKGVKVPHGSVVNLLESVAHEQGFTATDRIMAITTLSFDIHVGEIYLPLFTGGSVVVADKSVSANGQRIAEMIEQFNVSVLSATPATWRLLVDSGWKGKPSLRGFSSGEPMPVDLVEPVLARCKEFWNLYGPTETTVWSSGFKLQDPQAPILIGKPIANTQIYILDENLKPLPVGVPGEVYIGGAGVTLGYLNRAELTHSRFVENPFYNPFTDYVSSQIYRTGDIARFRHDGNIEYLYRNDKQVKLRGYRIELGEVENALATHPLVERTIALIRGDVTDDPRLVCYFTSNNDQVLTASDLRKHLRDSLPDYMIPQHFVRMAEFPQTENGKVDAKAFPAPEGVVHEESEFIAPESEQEIYLATLWQELLQVQRVSATDNFFNIGGHSLLVMKVIARTEEEYGVRLGPQDFLMGNLEMLAEIIADRLGSQNRTSSDVGYDAADYPNVSPRKSSKSILNKLKEFLKK